MEREIITRISTRPQRGVDVKAYDDSNISHACDRLFGERDIVIVDFNKDHIYLVYDPITNTSLLLKSVKYMDEGRIMVNRRSAFIFNNKVVDYCILPDVMLTGISVVNKFDEFLPREKDKPGTKQPVNIKEYDVIEL